MANLNLEHLAPLQERLDAHPIYRSVRDRRDLRVFMEHHIFSVWDFMSLVKYLQQHIAPARVPWMPIGDPRLRHFINQLVFEEESDALGDPQEKIWYGSHFELYCRAMEEIGADVTRPGRFLQQVAEQGLDAALYSELVPLPARYFTETTFCFIREDKPPLVAAALAVGRERLIPGMFRRLLDQMGLGGEEAPAFRRYLNRHIHCDADVHGPLSMQLLDTLCGDDPQRIEEAETAAEEAICARLRFWDGVLEAIETRRAP